MEKVMMKCGCSAQGVRTGTNDPVCVVHDCYEVAPTPDLTNRVSRCAYCKSEEPSSLKLPFFEYLGPGSREDLEMCGQCNYSKVVHERSTSTFIDNQIRDHTFRTKGPALFDRHYCGCRGWD